MTKEEVNSLIGATSSARTESVMQGFEIDWNSSQDEIRVKLQMFVDHQKWQRQEQKFRSRHRMFQTMFYVLLVFILSSAAWTLYIFAESTDPLRIGIAKFLVGTYASAAVAALIGLIATDPGD